MTEKEREEIWSIIRVISENLNRMGEKLDKLIESQREDREKAREMDERINKLFELHEKNEKEIMELREAQRESYKNLTKSISDPNGIEIIHELSQKS